jgi:hypothetical protein
MLQGTNNFLCVSPGVSAAAGYDTTSSAITYMLNQLVLNPHVLEQVRYT